MINLYAKHFRTMRVNSNFYYVRRLQRPLRKQRAQLVEQL